MPQERDEQGESHIHPGGKGEGMATGRSMERCHCQLMREKSNLWQTSAKCESFKVLSGGRATPFVLYIQCLQSSLAQDGGANHRQHCITDLQTTLKTWIERSKELPEIFENVLRSIWWVAGSEQPSPPLHRAAAARLLRFFDKYNSFYTRNILAPIFVEYNDSYLSEQLSSRAAAVR